jgi:hydroxymethylpyrimidine pyrophosphatase-like HAD family hydrolase
MPAEEAARRADRAVRLVACDLDGTLLLPDTTVSPRTLAAIGRLRQAGIAFLMVTGRPPRSVSAIARGAGLGGLAICANGALVYDLDADRVLTSTPLASGVGRRLVGELRKALPGVVFASETSAASGASPPGWGVGWTWSTRWSTPTRSTWSPSRWPSCWCATRSSP